MRKCSTQMPYHCNKKQAYVAMHAVQIAVGAIWLLGSRSIAG